MKNKTAFLPFSLIAGFTLTLLSACNFVDNQSVIPDSWQMFFNAAPDNANYLTSNAEHKVLIAVIDSGTDYNHPLLQKHIHYTVDKSGNVVGAGWDFLGKDAWPLPYLARTRFLYDEDQQVQDDEKLLVANISKLLQLEPSLSQWVHVHRNHNAEAEEGIFHGTHVAGLASYDDPRIGILPYRILPHQEALSESSKLNQSSEDFLNDLEEAITRAHNAGAKVINMSIGTSFGKTESGSEDMIKVFNEFESFVKSFPDVIFVAAAGNEKTWVNGENRYSFPCGINAQNIICVASLDKNGSPSEFTNIPLINSPLIFAPGENIFAPVPTQYCNSPSLANLAANLDQGSIGNLSQDILKDCSINGKAPLMALSGTSMASPIIARMLAQEVLKSESSESGAEIIQRFLGHSVNSKLGPLTMSKVKVPVPSWYSKSQDPSGMGLRRLNKEVKNQSSKYFEFYIKK